MDGRRRGRKNGGVEEELEGTEGEEELERIE